MQLAPKRNATAIRSKNGPRRIHSWNVFLVCANQAPPCFPLRPPIIRPFFSFRFFGARDGIPTRWSSGRSPSKSRAGATGTGYGETQRNIFYFRGLRTKYVLLMHAWQHGGGTTDWKIVVASWRILARGIPPAKRNFESSWGPLEIGGGISSLRTTISLTYLFYLPVPVALLVKPRRST